MDPVENVAPGAEEDFEWDPAISTVTAWSANNSRMHRGRRAYGRRGSRKASYGEKGAEGIARVYQRRLPFQDSNRGLDDDDASTELSGSLNSTEWGSASSGASLELTRSETLPAPPRPRPLGRHSRSKSITATGSRYRPPLLRHSRSMSVSSTPREFTRSSFSSASSSVTTGDSIFEQSENATPNVYGPDDENFSSHRSPQPPTKLKKIDLTPPNAEGAGFTRQKLLRQRQETELSDSSPSFVSPNSNNSFRRLAQSAESAAAWIKLPDLSPSVKGTIGVDYGYFADSNAASPTASVATTTSSRKRGVCELPFDDPDDFSVTTGHSFSCMSSPSLSARSRSRSRIFCNGSLAIGGAAANDSPAPSELFSRAGTDDDSLDEKSDRASDEDHSDDSSIEQAMDFELEVETSKAPAVMPPKPIRRSSSDNFEASVFGTDHKAVEDSKVLAPSYILETMCGYEDMKYLFKALRKEKLGRTVASFGPSKVWTVLPKSEWDSRRRAAFLQWARGSLGFSLRSGGGGVAYLQTSVSTGGNILESLEAAIVAHKQKAHEDTSDNKKSNLPVKDMACIVPSVTFSKRQSSSQPATSVAEPSPVVDGDVDMDLLEGMQSLNVADVKDPNNSSHSATKTSDSPLVRLVTMETDSTSPPNQVHLPLQILEEEEEVSPRLSTSDSHRLSGEHHFGGHDLVLHLHGISPTNDGSRTRPAVCRLPRMSASPYLQPLSVACHSASRGSNVPFDEDECLETPLMKRATQFWGSASNRGKDWGASAGCELQIIKELSRRFETAFQAAGFPMSSPFDEADEALEPSPSSNYFPSCIASAAVSSAALGFEDDFDMAENADNVDVLPTFGHGRKPSVGASVLAGLNLNDGAHNEEKLRRKRMLSFAKHRRVSLCAAVLPPVGSIPARRQTAFVSQVSILSPEAISLTERQGIPLKTISESTESIVAAVVEDPKLLSYVFSYLRESELLCNSSPVCTCWADAATASHASLMLQSVGCAPGALHDEPESDSDDESEHDLDTFQNPIAKSMERPWKHVASRFPWACFLGEGGFKNAYKVYNAASKSIEAISVMNLESISHIEVVGAELAISVMLSSLVRRNICPNFVVTRGVFTCPVEPPPELWGSPAKPKPRGGSYNARRAKPKALGRKRKQGKYQYIRMELCKHGDAEDFIKRQTNGALAPEESTSFLFQIAYALHVAADRYSMKHYDVKLLNIFLQDASPESSSDYTVLRYGLGEHVFALRLPRERALLAKLADYGTANVQASSNGQPVTIAQFTTVENTPPDFLLQGDAALQGHGHDSFGLGLCMLHLFTGHAPYEEILEDVQCPPALKKKLRQIWQEDEYAGYQVVRSIILPEDENDEPDETLYHTLYRYLVLFGIPEEKGPFKVWKAITQALEGSDRTRTKTYGRNARNGRKEGPDSAQFARDRKKFSLSHGNNRYIARARRTLQMMEGGMELLLSLVNFDPQNRATPLDVLNSSLMLPLREAPDATSNPSDHTLSFMAYASR